MDYLQKLKTLNFDIERDDLCKFVSNELKLAFRFSCDMKIKFIERIYGIFCCIEHIDPVKNDRFFNNNKFMASLYIKYKELLLSTKNNPVAGQIKDDLDFLLQSRNFNVEDLFDYQKIFIEARISAMVEFRDFDYYFIVSLILEVEDKYPHKNDPIFNCDLYKRIYKNFIGTKYVDKLYKQFLNIIKKRGLDMKIDVYNSDSDKCIICFEKNKNVMFVNCGHFAYCGACANKLCERKKCSLCNTLVSKKHIMTMKTIKKYCL